LRSFRQFKPTALLVAQNLCEWPQLLAAAAPAQGDRQFWICVSRWFGGLVRERKADGLVIAHSDGTAVAREKSQIILDCSQFWAETGSRRPIPLELQTLIRRMTADSRGVKKGKYSVWYKIV